LSIVTIGVDLTPVSEVSASAARFGRHYTGRLFTDRELADCGGVGDRSMQLAVLFAAKEATVKALAPGPGEFPEWRSIEVLGGSGGQPALVLSGDAASLAGKAGIDDWLLSTSFDGETASALVFGIRRLGDPAVPVISGEARICR